MKRLIFLLEEPSAEAMLRGIVPRILPAGIRPEYKVFEGKQDLEKRLPMILRSWKAVDCGFVVMRDQDSGDCLTVKQRPEFLCNKSKRRDLPVLIRIAYRELESFYLGDLAAVEKGIGADGLARRQNQRKYRDPDRLGDPSGEMARLTTGRYAKVAGSRAIGVHLDLEQNKSRSFNVLVAGITRISGASR